VAQVCLKPQQAPGANTPRGGGLGGGCVKKNPQKGVGCFSFEGGGGLWVSQAPTHPPPQKQNPQRVGGGGEVCGGVNLVSGGGPLGVVCWGCGGSWCIGGGFSL